MPQFLVAAYFAIQAEDADAADWIAARSADHHNKLRAIDGRISLNAGRDAALYLDEVVPTTGWEGDAPHSVMDFAPTDPKHPEVIAALEAAKAFILAHGPADPAYDKVCDALYHMTEREREDREIREQQR